MAELEEQWAELCKEFRAAQARTATAMSTAWSAGRFAPPSAMDEINRCREVEEEIKKRMDAFIDRHSGR